METKKITIVLVCILMLSFSAVNSQIVVSGSDYLLAKLRLNEGKEGIKYIPYNDITGDPYIYKDFRSGMVFFKTGETFKADLRYDIYGDLIQIKHNDDVFGIYNTGSLSKITIDTLTFIYDNIIISTGDKEPSGNRLCFIVKREGRCDLLIRKNMRIQDAEPPKLYQNAKPAKFIHLKETYYLKPENSYAIRIQSKKDLFSVLNDKQEELRQFIRTNKLTVKDLNDLDKIVSYYNGI